MLQRLDLDLEVVEFGISCCHLRVPARLHRLDRVREEDVEMIPFLLREDSSWRRVPLTLLCCSKDGGWKFFRSLRSLRLPCLLAPALHLALHLQSTCFACWSLLHLVAPWRRTSRSKILPLLLLILLCCVFSLPCPRFRRPLKRHGQVVGQLSHSISLLRFVSLLCRVCRRKRDIPARSMNEGAVRTIGAEDLPWIVFGLPRGKELVRAEVSTAIRGVRGGGEEKSSLCKLCRSWLV
mmetsp:Transcript_15670/g.35895  ORF Transcript_15670/g.35895 Transcript_15670/m.35895 type:complete len:237 (-) Transcript_15670:301-1011(-)